MSGGDDVWSKCFLCSSTLSYPLQRGDTAQVQVEKSRGGRRSRRIGRKVPSKPHSKSSKSWGHPSNNDKARKEIVFKYLLSACQDINLEKRLISSSSLFKLCNPCEQVATTILNFHLQLEVLQIKLIEELKKLKRLVTSYSDRRQGEQDKRRKLTADCDDMDLSPSQLLFDFQEFISKNEKHQVEVPLLRLKMFTGSGHLPNISSLSPRTCVPPTRALDDDEHRKNVLNQDCSLELGTEMESLSSNASEPMTSHSDIPFDAKIIKEEIPLEEYDHPADSPHFLGLANSPEHSDYGEKSKPTEKCTFPGSIPQGNETTLKEQGYMEDQVSDCDLANSRTRRIGQVASQSTIAILGDSREHSNSEDPGTDDDDADSICDKKDKQWLPPGHKGLRQRMKKTSKNRVRVKRSTFPGSIPKRNESTLEEGDMEDQVGDCGFANSATNSTEPSNSDAQGTDDDDEEPIFDKKDELWLPPRPGHKDQRKKTKNMVKRYAFSCDLCPFKSQRGSRMELHYRLKHEKGEKEKPHQCSKCSSKFSREQALAVHIRVHHNPNRTKFWKERLCDLCGLFSTTSKMDWKAHIVTVHPQDQRFNCDLCEDVFVSFVKLIEHSKGRHFSTKLKCALCPNPENGPLLIIQSDLHRHLVEAHRVSDYRLECDLPNCSQKFYFPYQLTKHKATCHRTSFPCEECSLDFSSRSDFKQHHNEVHNEEYQKRPHKCDLCSQAFLKIGSLLKHKMADHGLPGLKCELCPFSEDAEIFTSGQSLWYHRERFHPDLVMKYTFRCSLCPKKFKTRQRWTRHELTHGTPKSFYCEQCGFVTSTKSNLQRHSRRVHAPAELEKAFCCEICGYASARKDNLRQHMKMHGEKTLQCSQCPKRFYNPDHLKQHEFTHGTERNYQCHLCGLSFKHKSSIQLHNRRKHRKDGNGTAKEEESLEENLKVGMAQDGTQVSGFEVKVVTNVNFVN